MPIDGTYIREKKIEKFAEDNESIKFESIVLKNQNESFRKEEELNRY